MFTLELCWLLLECGDGDLAFLLFAHRRGTRWRSSLFWFLTTSMALAMHRVRMRGWAYPGISVRIVDEYERS